MEKLGPFELNNIYQGDCLELMKDIPDNSVDCVITDPPYGINYQSNFRKNKHSKIHGDISFPIESINECIRISKRCAYIFCRWEQIELLPKPKSVIAWIKNNWSMGDLKHEHGRQWEACCFFPQEQHKFIKRIPDVIFSERTGNNLHPTEKPVKLISTLISCNTGNIILDPFAGSGTTLVAAKQLGRKYLGFELEEKYCEIARKRLAQEELF